MRSTRVNDERGAITVWTAAVLTGFVLIVGIGVDFAGQVKAAQEARGVAVEAARVGGEHLGMPDGRVSPDTSVGKQAAEKAEKYVAASRFKGTARVNSSGVVEVQVTGEYRCLFLNVIGITTLPVTAQGTSDVILD